MTALCFVIGLLFVFILMVLLLVRLSDWKAKLCMVLILLLVVVLMRFLTSHFPGM